MTLDSEIQEKRKEIDWTPPASGGEDAATQALLCARA